MALRKVRLSSWDPEADTSLDEIEVGEDGPPKEFEHGGLRFVFSHLEVASNGTTEDATLVYTDARLKP